MLDSRKLFLMILFSLVGMIITFFVLLQDNTGLTTKAIIVSERKGDQLNLSIQPATVIRSYVAGDTLHPRNLLFHQTPPFLMWNILMVIMVAITAGALPFFTGLVFD